MELYQHHNPGICMRGSIYSGQHCLVCGAVFVYDRNRRGLFCPSHPDQSADKSFRVQFGRDVMRRFQHFPEAEQFLEGLRHEWTQGKFDPRDYRSDNPLGFQNLSEKWLKHKKEQVKPRTHILYKNYISIASNVWGNQNVKTIGYSDIDDLFLTLRSTLSNKTISNIRGALHQFFSWVNKREGFPMPEIPDVRFELGWRKLVDKTTQATIIREVKRISYHLNPKIWLGIRWLSIYVRMRPGELVKVKESEVNVNGFLIIPSPKEKKPKMIALLPEDIELLQGIKRGFPEQRFFRHGDNIKGTKADTPFADKMFRKWWNRACDNLDIKGVDLYGGTRHSTVNYLKRHFTKDEIKTHGTGHDTNKAFDRYFGEDVAPSMMVSQVASDGLKKKSKVVKIKTG